MRMKSLLLAGAIGLLAQSAWADTPEVHALRMVWKPLSSNGEVTAIEVQQQVDGVAANDGKPFSLTAPVTYVNVTGVADRITRLDVRDASGPISFTTEDDKPVPGGFPYYRHWRATRAVSYPVTISYTALVQPAGSPGGPAFGIRPSGGGVSGSAAGFLLLPENAGTTQSNVSWDLSNMPAGSVGVTTFGDGAFEVKGAANRVNQSWIMAGPAQQYAAKGASHFHAYWLGTPSFDAEAAMQWTAKAYTVLSTALPHIDPAPDYRVFMRALDTPPYGGGTALGNSFMLSMSKSAPKDPQDLRITFFHEMTHQWSGGIDGGTRINDSAWFHEGLTVYFTTMLPLEGGLYTLDEYAALLNRQAADYYTSPARDWSAARIVEVGFGDERIRHTPYLRGFLYFADLDARIRKASKGKRTLRSVLHPLLVARQKGERFDYAVWKDMLRKELGEEAVAEFQTILVDGAKVVVPPSEAFGPCFVRQAVELKADSGPVQGYQWGRKKGVADAKCRKW
jgi:hypothetical protein